MGEVSAGCWAALDGRPDVIAKPPQMGDKCRSGTAWSGVSSDTETVEVHAAWVWELDVADAMQGHHSKAVSFLLSVFLQVLGGWHQIRIQVFLLVFCGQIGADIWM